MGIEQKYNQAQFDLLPGIVSVKEFLQWTGLSRDDFYAEVAAGSIEVYRAKKKGYMKCYKRESGRICKFIL